MNLVGLDTASKTVGLRGGCGSIPPSSSKLKYTMLEILSLISLSLIAFILLTLWALWVLYIAMMNIKRVEATQAMPLRVKILVYPTIVVFELVEIVANVFVCSIIFLDWPREVRVSDRLRRYWVKPEKYGWRLHIVKFLKPMLDPFDPAGPHI